MKMGGQEDEEIESLLGEIPLATSLPLHSRECDGCHHRYNRCHHGHGCGNGHAHGGVGLFPSNNIHGDGDKRVHAGYRQEHHGHGHDDPPCHGGYVCVSPVTPSAGSSSSSASGAPSLDDDGLSVGLHHGFNQNFPARRTAGCMYGFCNSPQYELLNSMKGIDELGLSNKLQAMSIGDSNYGNLLTKGPLDDCRSVYSYCYNEPRCPVVPDSALIDEEKRSMMMRLQHQYLMGDLPVSQRLNGLDSYPGMYLDLRSCQWKQGEHLRGDNSMMNLNLSGSSPLYEANYYQGVQVPKLTTATLQSPYMNESIFASCGISSEPTVDYGAFSSPIMHPNQSLGINSGGHHLQHGVTMKPNGWSSPSNSTMRMMSGFNAFNCEEGFILEGKNLNYAMKNSGLGLAKGFSHSEIGRRKPIEKKVELSSSIGHGPWDYSHVIFPVKYNSLSELQGSIYVTAKDQIGCRFLQKKVSEGNPQDFQMIFGELVVHMVELMMNPFANYLVQRMLDVCNEDQTMQITKVVTAKAGELVKISLNTHGTRAVQRLIQTIKTHQQISLLAVALEPGFPELITDNNGNHVVQRCLECFPIEDKQFIIKAAAEYSITLATHQHGCRVLQRCIGYTSGDFQIKMSAKIAANGLFLAQDTYGNYVIQCIMHLDIPSVTAILISQFEGQYVNLSMQKHSSNVVQDCLRLFNYEVRCRIIHELLSASPFDNLLQDAYGNYVIQTALVVSKGTSLHASLVAAIQPFATALRTSPFCKRVFSLINLRR